MPDGQVLEFTNVTKRFNEVTAVSDFSARVEPGAVTAFLGPNGAGKTTTLRILLGQVRATSGTATIGGVAYAELRQPLRTIGSVLEETAYRPRRTASRQLTIAAKANGIPLARVDEVLGMVGLDSEADSRIGGFSLGMRQRLSVAHALLGDPGALVFDEPANGLDPEGIRWIRLLMRRLADEGRTVLVSSHLLSEIEQVADNVLVLSKGHLVLASGIETLADPKGGSVVVDAADRAALTAALSAAGFDVEVLRSGLTVRGGDAGTVGAVAAEAGIALSTLVQRGPTLEDVFIDLVRGGKLGARAGAAPAPSVASESAGATGAGIIGAGIAGAELAGAGIAGAAIAGAGVAGAAVAVESIDEAAAEAADAGDEGDDASPDDSSIDDASRAEDADTEDAGAADAGASAGDADIADDSAEETAEETETEDASADGTPDVDAPAEDTSPDGVADAPASDSVEVPQDGNTDSETPTRSFDEILFGAAAPASSAESAQEGTGHDVGEVFADSEDAAADEPRDPDAEAEAAADTDDHAGVEFFAELGETAAADEGSPDADSEDDTSATEGDEPEAETSEGDDDPRSAAVSSMLAAAARAYYEDEPKDYPQGAATTGDDGAQWSVASTGVIDTVPLASSADDTSEDSAAAEHGDGENHEGEHHDGENHNGEHHHGDDHDSEHHGDQHHG